MILHKFILKIILFGQISSGSIAEYNHNLRALNHIEAVPNFVFLKAALNSTPFFENT